MYRTGPLNITYTGRYIYNDVLVAIICAFSIIYPVKYYYYWIKQFRKKKNGFPEDLDMVSEFYTFQRVLCAEFLQIFKQQRENYDFS